MANENKVTPWDVEGSVDYEKLIKEFGVQKITKEQREYLKQLAQKKGLDEHIFIKRGLFFAQRDLQEFINAHKKGEPIFIYTGIGPSGPLHIGHLIPFRFTKYLQDLFDCNLYIQITDDEKIWTKKNLTIEDTNEYATSNILDVIANGFNPDKTFIFKDIEYIANMYPLLVRVSKKISYAKAKAIFGFNNSSNIGHIFYPAIQTMPTFFENGKCLIAYGIDQDNYFRLQRDFAKQLGFHKCVGICNKFLIALQGPNSKMSASKAESCIYTYEEPSKVKKKVNKYAFSGGQPTLEEHREKGGNTDIDVAYQWLYNLFEEDENKILEIKKAYESGEMLSGEIKKILIEKINSYLEAHNKAKQKAIDKNLIEQFMYKGKLAKQMWNKIHQ